MRRTFSLAAGAVAALLVVAVAPVHPAAAQTLPSSMAALGDSLTRAFGTNLPTSGGDYPARSYSTGDDPAVNSLYQRILAQNPAIAGYAFNDALSGSRMREVQSQMANAVNQHVEFVTVLSGGNDICANSSEAEMTSVSDYRDAFQQAMAIFAAGLPGSRVLVISIPNIYRAWEVMKDAGGAEWWDQHGTCPPMFAHPTSTDQTDVDRRARVLQREIDYHTQLQEVCALYTQCVFDNNTDFNLDLQASDFGPDFLHPNTQWHAKLAEALTPFIPYIPTVSVNPSSGPKGTTVSLTGTEFAPGEQAKLKYKTGLTSPRAYVLCMATVQQDKTFACSGEIPGGKYGKRGVHTIVAKGLTSLIKVKTTFTRA